MATPVLVRTEKWRARLNPKSHQSLLVCCSSSGSSAALAPQPSSQSAIYVREAAQPSNRLDPLTRVARGDVPVHQERSSRHHRPVHHKEFASEVARSIHGRKIAFTCRMARTTWTVKGGGTSTGSQAPSNFAQFSMEFRALERPIRRISVVSHPEANGRFPESRDMKDFCWNHHGFVPLTSVCFSSPRLEREPSPMVSSPNGRVFKTDGEEENQS